MSNATVRVTLENLETGERRGFVTGAGDAADVTLTLDTVEATLGLWINEKESK